MTAQRRPLLMAAVVAALLVLALAITIALIDINRYKPEIEQAVKTHTGRTLLFKGDLGLSIFPKLAITLPASTLSARNGEAEFLSFTSARVAVALLPLLRQTLVVESIDVLQPRATVTRQGDGSLEVDDMFDEPAGPVGHGEKNARETPEPRQRPDEAVAADWEIGRLVLTDGAITLREGGSGKTIALSAINLETGRLAPKAKLPLSLTAHVTSTAPEFAGNLELAATLDLDLAASVFAATDFKLSFAGTRGFEARLAGPLSVNIESRTLDMPQIDGEISMLNPQLPEGSARVAFTGAMKVDGSREHVDLKLASRAADASLKATITLENFAQPEIGFDVEGDRLNVDRYLAPAGKAAAASPPAASAAPGHAVATAETAPGAGAATENAATKATGVAATAPPTDGVKAAAPAATPSNQAFDLSPLRDLRLDGKLQIGQLQLRGIQATAVRASVRGAAGRTAISPLSAQLYGGKGSGDLTLDAQGNRGSLNLTLNDVEIGGLARDALGRNDLGGRGDFRLALSTSGQSRAELTRTAQGTGRFALRDFALVGIDLSAVLGRAMGAFKGGGTQGGKIDRSQRTVLSRLSGTVRLADGVARNDDLDGATAQLGLGGSGQFDLLSKNLDYTLRVTVSANPVQSSKLLTTLAGVTVPVHFNGPTDDLRYSINLSDVLTNALAHRGVGAAVVEEAERFLGRMFGRDKKK
ncbi:AsmA family protein [Accumulibacter sp.]|uniref:AsmA family protein n=1 Tax=Accumulibacter sp. TaxID=2053492 RepID=UPI0028C3DC23|nr:AsmA family protein [Accumulibacter sp.]